MPAIKGGLELGDGQFSVALLGLEAGAVLGLQLGGLIVPRVGSRRALTTSLVVFTCELLGPAFAPSLLLLAASLFAFAALNSLVDVAMSTLDILSGTDEFEDPAGPALWLADHRLVPSSPYLNNEDLGRARRLREALRSFLMANAGLPLDPGAAAAFDDAAGPVRLRTTADEGWLELLPSDEEGLDHAIGRLVSIVFAAQRDGTWSRLKVCAECHWALYDHTKNHSAASCGSQCSARVRSRRYHQRRSSPA